jgi:3-deoxy-D-manno-octulosonic-acid transferase
MTSLLYNLALHTMIGPALAAWYLPKVAIGGKYRRSFRGKLGRLPADFDPARIPRPRVWVHAVSVGEVAAAKPLIEQLQHERPDVGLVVSTGTETGQDRARSTLTDVPGFCYLPLDFPAFVQRVADRIEPDLFVLMETELWPNLVRTLKQRGTPIVLANGRISDRSFPRYLRFRKLFAQTLESINLYSMASTTDAERIIRMGAPPDRVYVTGNTKFDAAFADPEPGIEGTVRSNLDIPATAKVIVAGSTHPGEHETVLEAFYTLLQDFSDLLLILVPRHVEKVPRLLASMQERGMPQPFLRSAVSNGERRNGRSVIVVDTTGELFSMYSVADIVFIGGSLVPKGGQNILEPAAWGKPVLFGPSMEDFRDAKNAFLKVGCGFQVRDCAELQAAMRKLLSDPVYARACGERGRAEIMSHAGSAKRNAEILASMIR